MLITAYSLWQMTQFSPDMTYMPMVLSGLSQGFGIALVYVPLSATAFSTLDPSLRNEGAALFSLMRNIGSSAGISVVLFMLTRNTQTMHASLAATARMPSTDPTSLQIASHVSPYADRSLAAIDAAMTFLAAEDAASGKPVRVTDLCAGSGAIGLAIANEVPNALVTLVEASEDAWVYLRRNVRAQPPEVQERVRTVLADARNCLRHMDACADVVVANPPYIPSDMVPVDPEVEHYDPPQALYGLGPDGLQVPKDITDEAVRLLRIGGVLIVEHGDRQGLAMREFASSSVYWEGVSTLKDLTGRDRMLVARRIGA